MTSSTLSPRSARFRGTFYIPVVLGLAGMLAFFGLVAPLFRFGILAWIDPQAVAGHLLHSVAESTLFSLPIVGLALQLHQAQEKVASMQMTLLILGVTMIVALLLLPDFVPVMGIFLILALAAGALHPARGEVFRLHRPLNAWAAALAAIALMASLSFIVDHLQMQYLALPGDEHAEIGHWAITGTFALSVPLLALLGSFSTPGWRIPAISAAVLATLYGLASILHPGQISTLGVTGGIVTIAWAGLYLALNMLRRPAQG